MYSSHSGRDLGPLYHMLLQFVSVLPIIVPRHRALSPSCLSSFSLFSVAGCTDMLTVNSGLQNLFNWVSSAQVVTTCQLAPLTSHSHPASLRFHKKNSSPRVHGVEGAPTQQHFISEKAGGTPSSTMVTTGPSSMCDFLIAGVDVCLRHLRCDSIRVSSVPGQGHVCIHKPHCPGGAEVWGNWLAHI